jgi:hypothetical protein
MKAYLGIISLAGAEQSFQWVVSGDDKAGEVNQEFASNVEKDEEEVQGQEAKDDIDFGNWRLALKVVEGWVLGELLVQVADVVLDGVNIFEDDWSLWHMLTWALSWNDMVSAEVDGSAGRRVAKRYGSCYRDQAL